MRKSCFSLLGISNTQRCTTRRQRQGAQPLGEMARCFREWIATHDRRANRPVRVWLAVTALIRKRYANIQANRRDHPQRQQRIDRDAALIAGSHASRIDTARARERRALEPWAEARQSGPKTAGKRENSKPIDQLSGNPGPAGRRIRFDIVDPKPNMRLSAFEAAMQVTGPFSAEKSSL